MIYNNKIENLKMNVIDLKMKLISIGVNVSHYKERKSLIWILLIKVI